MTAGEQVVGWDLKDDSGSLVKPGTYSWKAILHPGLEMKYEMTAYPNVSMVNAENSPWLNGPNAAGGWMADHTAPRAVASHSVFLKGDRHYVYVEEGQGKFRRREVKVGIETSGKITVLEGLEAGQRVVTTGALLIEEIASDAAGS